MKQQSAHRYQSHALRYRYLNLSALYSATVNHISGS